MKKQLVVLVGLCALLAIFFGQNTAVYATSDNANFSLKMVPGDTASSAVQGYYLFAADGGNTINSQIMVVNEGREAGRARIYVVDALTGQTSGTVFASRESANSGMSSWITLDETEIFLNPGESQMIPYQVMVPQGVRAGNHVGGIAVEAIKNEQQNVVEAEQNQAAFRVVVNTRTVMAVQVDIPGERIEQVNVTTVTFGGSSGYQVLFLNMQNQGNVMLKPTGSLVVTNEENQTVQSLPFQMDTFLPETEIAYPLFVENEALPAGSYTADLTLTYGEKTRAETYHLPLEITAAQNAEVFSEQRAALAAPDERVAVIDSEAKPQPKLPYWQVFVTGGLGFLDAMLVLVLGVLIYKYVGERRQVTAPNNSANFLAHSIPGTDN